ncbi:probable ESF2 Eighteen S rRNA processing Factor [Rhynchosporium agropyri]|uniref:18S rRNA factor 2 n=1 Tax=Rhynchosporium agropyri TaxID=914238 RepID=A0A1E1JTN5_9HELO|nr:probable ESF2 Eighteen S rRNA processing Factor [Rhynchosporium agropyri]
MTTRKHNEFLDADESEDDQTQGYDSEVEDVKKGGRNTKRRKVDSDLSDNDEAELDDKSEGEEEQERDDAEDKEEDSKDTRALKRKSRDTGDIAELPGVHKHLSKKNLVATAAAIKKSGVVYLSRIPPFMKPQKLRSLLEPYGAINRIFMTPEDPTSHTRRVRNGGNKKRSFVDGWVEFVNKVHAKHVCELLNAKTIGGKKGTYYHDDVWNLLYLKGFKWNNLTEQIASENAERASRMRAEISKTTKENKEFVQNVERAKMLEGMEAKKAAKRRKDIDDKTESTAPTKEKRGGERARQFKQTPVAKKMRPEDQPEQVKRVLSKIF